MGFQGSRLVFHGSRSVFMVFNFPGWFFMVPGGFLCDAPVSWDYMSKTWIVTMMVGLEEFFSRSSFQKCLEHKCREPGISWNHIIWTRSHAALWVADLDWIVEPGYSWGKYIWRKTMKNPPGTMKNQPLRHKHRAPIDLLWCKNVIWLSRGPSRPPLMQKRDMTNTGPQPTS